MPRPPARDRPAERKPKQRAVEAGVFRLRPRGLAPLFAAAAILFFIPTITSVRRESATFDEPVYVVAGLAYATLHDFTMKDDAPPIVGYLAGMSPKAHGLSIPGGRLGFSDSFGHEYPYAKQVLYGRGVPADDILFGSRMAVLIPFGILLLLTVMCWSWEMFGPHAAGTALLLTALCPNLIAHGGLVAADFPCAATMLFASWLLWRAARQPSRGRLIASGLALGLALGTKFTAILLAPSFALVLAISALQGRGSRQDRALGLARMLALTFIPAAIVITVVYGWPPQPGRYIAGVTGLYRNVRPGFAWYLFGSFHKERPLYYYLVTLLVKASAPLLILGIGSLFLIRRRTSGMLGELCLFVPAALILGASSLRGESIGIRHVLGVLPVLAVSAGRWMSSPGGAFPRRRTTIFIAVLLAWHAVSSFASWPSYIPYFNEVAGGRANGSRILDDSNVDWGQDLKSLPPVLASNGIHDVRLSYFGSADPRWYGIEGKDATVEEIAKRMPGVYAISLNYVIRLRQVGITWPSETRPFARAGTSILLYRVGSSQ